jgi:hypothetical protein
LTQSNIQAVSSVNINQSSGAVTRGQCKCCCELICIVQLIEHNQIITALVSFQDGTTLVSTVAFCNAWDQSLLLIANDLMIEVDDFVLDAHNSGFYNDAKTPLSFRVRTSKDRN